MVYGWYIDCHTIFSGRPCNLENRLITRGVAFIKYDAHLRMLLQYWFKIEKPSAKLGIYRFSGLAIGQNLYTTR
jgi:hypothetical protein